MVVAGRYSSYSVPSRKTASVVATESPTSLFAHTVRSSDYGFRTLLRVSKLSTPHHHKKPILLSDYTCSLWATMAGQVPELRGVGGKGSGIQCVT